MKIKARLIKLKSWFISISAALILGLGGLYVIGFTEPQAISGYSQSEKSVAIELTHAKKPIKFLMLPNVPETLNIELLEKNSENLNLNQGKITIQIKNEPTSGEYSILIFSGSDYLELVRQSQHWLKSTFNFDRPGGYTILGRRSLATKDSTKAGLTPLVFFKKPEKLRFKPASVSSYDEINYATGLLKKMWSKPIFTGPTPQSYSQFLETTFQEKMRRVQTGEFAVMCQGFRDLFLHASSADDRFRVRPVEAHNYSPQIPDLISFSHSTAEVYVSSLNKWVLFDPWLGIIVTENGVPIGAAEMAQLKGQEALVVVPLMDHLPRVYKTKDGQLVNNPFVPKDVRLFEFSRQVLGCSPGYQEYFKTFVVRDYLIK